MINLNPSTMIKSMMAGGLVFLFVTAFLRCYMRTNTTLIGYRLGELKGHEAELLEERSRLRMQLATLTTKASLSLKSKTMIRGRSVRFTGIQ